MPDEISIIDYKINVVDSKLNYYQNEIAIQQRSINKYLSERKKLIDSKFEIIKGQNQNK